MEHDTSRGALLRRGLPLAAPLAVLGAALAWLVLDRFDVGSSLATCVALAAVVCATTGFAWALAPESRGPRIALHLGGLAFAAGVMAALFRVATRGELTALAIPITLAFGVASLPVIAAHVARRSARPASVVARSQSRGVAYATALAVVIAAWTVSRISYGWYYPGRKGNIIADGASLATQALELAGAAVVVVVAALDVAVLFKLLRELDGAERARDATEEPPGAPVLDLGVGDERWCRAATTSHPYRGARRAAFVVFGAPQRVQALLTMFAIGHVAGAIVVAALLVLTPARARFVPTVEVSPASSTQHPNPVPVTAAPSWPNLGWYDRAPILVDLDGDGVDDVVGLRWDSAHTEAALVVSATNGATFEPMWRSKPMRSQWGSYNTQLVRSQDRLFVSDSQGLVHLLDLGTGEEAREPLAFEHARHLCGRPDTAVEAWFNDHDDWRRDSEGLLVDKDGTTKKAPWPAWCVVGGHRLCERPGPGACARVRGAYDNALEEGDVGVTGPFSIGDHGWKLTGYDPKSGSTRWKGAIPFSDAEVHAEPRLKNDLAGGRLFSLYQLKSGLLELGARDAKTGGVVWHRTLPHGALGTTSWSLTGTPSRLYVLIDGGLEVFDAADGRPLGIAR